MRNGPAGEAYCHRASCTADGKIALLIASSQARTTTSSVFDADRLLQSPIPLFGLRKTPKSLIGADFGCFGGVGGVDSGYAGWGLVPMWERWDGSGWCGEVGGIFHPDGKPYGTHNQGDATPSLS